MVSKHAKARLAEYAARIASGLNNTTILDEAHLPNNYRAAVVNVASRILIYKNEVIYCNLCGKGPFTPKGAYLHLRRMHGAEIISLIEDEASRVASTSKRVKA